MRGVEQETAAMAAAALSRSLFFIFTLLSLVFLTSSLLIEEQLEKLKKDLKSAEQSMDRMMEDYLTTLAAAKDLLDDFPSSMKPLIALMKRFADQSNDDFPDISSYMEKILDFIEKNRAYIDRYSEEVTALMEDSENQCVKYEKFLEDLEEHLTEL